MFKNRKSTPGAHVAKFLMFLLLCTGGVVEQRGIVLRLHPPVPWYECTTRQLQELHDARRTMQPVRMGEFNCRTVSVFWSMMRWSGGERKKISIEPLAPAWASHILTLNVIKRFLGATFWAHTRSKIPICILILIFWFLFDMSLFSARTWWQWYRDPQLPEVCTARRWLWAQLWANTEDRCEWTEWTCSLHISQGRNISELCYKTKQQCSNDHKYFLDQLEIWSLISTLSCTLLCRDPSLSAWLQAGLSRRRRLLVMSTYFQTSTRWLWRMYMYFFIAVQIAQVAWPIWSLAFAVQLGQSGQ